LKDLKALWNRFQKAIAKDAANLLVRPKFSEFNPDEYDIEDSVIEELRGIEECEKLYYGF